MYIPDELLSEMLASRTQVLKVLVWLLLNVDEKGEIQVSGRKLADAVGISHQEARTALRWCVSNTRLTHLQHTTNTLGMLVTFNDIDAYKPSQEAPNTHLTHLQHTTNTLKDKETEKEKSLSSSPNNPINSLSKEKDKEKETASVIAHARKIFRKPTAEEVEAYCREKGYTLRDGAQYFIDFYETNGWVQGKSQKPIKDWKACVRTWVRNDSQHQSKEEIGEIYFGDNKPQNFEPW